MLWTLPNYISILRTRAHLLSMDEDQQAACADLQRVIQLDGNWRDYHARGHTFGAIGKTMLAERTYRIATVLEPGDRPPPNNDVHCPSMSLPFVLGLSAKDIAKIGPYLMTDPDNVERWDNMIGKSKARSVGIWWRTSSPSVNSGKKSLALYPILHHLPQGLNVVSL